ncbi:MAG: helix-turn-helix domain-containing protein [Planctomycetes bacterium]|nr:helix-turn-helix domain-containing protein [Planctomycetota bacterium]
MHDPSVLLGALGRETRELRRARGWTRRDLADRTGISERFLADVESGRANPSLQRLCQLAAALDVLPSALLAAAERRGAGPRTARLALLGLRGAGKSTVGAAVAEAVGCPLLELDAEIERRAGLTLAQLFELNGEEDFRRQERETLEAVLTRGPAPVVIATGGGIVTAPQTFTLLRSNAFTVWLRARPEDHWNRVVAQGDTRPITAGQRDRDAAFGAMRRILDERQRSYETADATVDTSGRDVADIAREVAAHWETARGARQTHDS